MAIAWGQHLNDSSREAVRAIWHPKRSSQRELARSVCVKVCVRRPRSVPRHRHGARHPQTFTVTASIASLFDHLVGACERRGLHCEVERSALKPARTWSTAPPAGPAGVGPLAHDTYQLPLTPKFYLAGGRRVSPEAISQGGKAMMRHTMIELL